MFARVTLVEIDTVRMNPDIAVARFQEQVLPELRGQAGYQGLYVLMNPDGKALLMSLWSTQEQAQSNVASGYYEAQLQKFSTVFASPPGREQYGVVFVDTPVSSAGLH
jgi:heme-degrading monooxygenase HmoA